MWTRAGAEANAERLGRLVEAARSVRSGDEMMALAIAALHPARAAVQLARDTAEAGSLRIGLRKFDRMTAEVVPHAELVRRLRVEDFHLTGLIEDARWLKATIRVPARSTVQVTLGPVGRPGAVQVVGSKGMPKFRMLLWHPPFVQCRPEAEPVHLLRVLDAYRAALPAFFAAVERHA